MKFSLELFPFVVLTVFTQAESSTTKRPETPSNGAWRNFIRSSEFGDKIGIELHNFFLNTGKCLAEMGPDAIYDIDRKTCRDCSDDNCTNDVACKTQCSDIRRLFELEFHYRSLTAQDQYLDQKTNYIIVALSVLCAAVSVLAIIKIYKWHKSRYDRTEAPEADKKPYQEELLQEDQHAAQ